MLGKKIPTILGLLLLGVVVGSIYYLMTQTKPKSSLESAPSNVKLTNVADNKFSVSWTTKTATVGEVEYAVVGGKLNNKVQDDKGGGGKYLTHHVSVGGLQPNTQYSFRILSGEPQARYDNNGVPYTVTTGASIASIPAARSIYGEVAGASEDAIIYISLPGAAPASTVLKNNGSYSLSISTLRSTDLRSFATYDPSATVVGITLETGTNTTVVSASTANIAPVPKITVGKNEDFRNTTPQQATVAQVVEQQPQQSQQPETPTIFNVEPLVNNPEINEVADKGTTLTNPEIEGEVLTTTKPEFAGTGEQSSVIGIAITGQKSVSDTVRVGIDGNWSWTPPIELKTGKQKIVVTYTDENDKAQKIERSFSITAAKIDSQPAFVATSSGKPSRTTMPATESGVPVTGVMTPTIMTIGIGIIGILSSLVIFAL